MAIVNCLHGSGTSYSYRSCQVKLYTFLVHYTLRCISDISKFYRMVIKAGNELVIEGNSYVSVPTVRSEWDSLKYALDNYLVRLKESVAELFGESDAIIYFLNERHKIRTRETRTAMQICEDKGSQQRHAHKTDFEILGTYVNLIKEAIESDFNVNDLCSKAHRDGNGREWVEDIAISQIGIVAVEALENVLEDMQDDLKSMGIERDDEGNLTTYHSEEEYEEEEEECDY